MDIKVLKQLILSPITFQDVSLEFIDVLDAYHAPGWQVKKHKHPWFEFNYVCDGTMITELEHCEYATGKGEGLLIPPGLLHSNRGTDSQADHGFCIRFTLKKIGKDVGGLFDELMRVLTVVRDASFPCDVSMLFQHKSLPAVQATAASWLFGLYDQWITDPRTVSLPSAYNISNQVILYLNEYYQSKIYVTDIAKALNMSYRNLARMFKKETGISIIEKLTEIRVNKAKQLLLSTDDTMLEIATAVGFENEYYFSNAFNDYLMQRPSQFRKTHREK